MEFKDRKVKKSRRDGMAFKISTLTGEGNFVDKWLTVNNKTVMPEGIADANDLFNAKKKVDIEARDAGSTIFANKITFAVAA